MPTDSHLYTAPPHGFARAPVSVKTGLAGKAGASVRPADSYQDTAPLGADHSIAAPTGVSASDPALRSGEVDVAFTYPAGITKLDIIVVTNADGKFVKRQEKTGASPAAVTGLTNGTAYGFYVRGVASDGRVGPFAAKVTATPTA